MGENEYYTFRGYSQNEKSKISTSMEDYLEMIYRHNQAGGYVRVNQLAALLNVTPPSSSKMVLKLKENGLVDFEPYGIIQLTERGNEVGEYLLHRHNILHQFFCKINGTQNELELVEKIEHFFDKRTIDNIEGKLKTSNQI